MGFLASFLNTSSSALSSSNYGFWFGSQWLGTSSSGVWVSTERARTIAAVYACVKILSEDIAKLPLFVYQRGEEGAREKAEQHQLYELLHFQPNRWQTSFEWREMIMGHVLLRGNAYSQLIFGPTGIEQIVPRHPDRVQVVQNSDGSLGYVWYPPEGEPIAIADDSMFHLRGYSSDGIRGDSVIAAMRDTLGHTVAADEHGARFFKNSAQVPFAISHPGKISEPAYKRLVAAQEQASGVENAGRSMILEEGMKIEKIGITNEDSQYLETRQFQLAEVCRFFRMPPHKIGDLTRATFSNIEHQSIEYVTDTLMPWCARFEQAGRRDLISQKAKFFLEFALQGLLRGDSTSRSNYYSSAIRTGWMSRNEARQLENMNPADGLDEFLSDLSMGKDGEEEEPERREPEEDDPEAKRTTAIVSELCRKLVRQEALALASYYAKYSEPKARQKRVERFFGEHSERIQKALFVNQQDAEFYCVKRAAKEYEKPLDKVETWEEVYGAELLALALGGKQ